MPQRSGLYDSVKDANGNEDRPYTTEDLARAFRATIGDGVVGDRTALQVTETTPPTRGVAVAPGVDWVQGRRVEVYDAPLVLNLPTPPDPTNPRIDLVVARRNLDPNVRDGGVFIRAGQAGLVPAPPQPQQDVTIWEDALAEIRVEPNVASITNANLRDRRTFAAAPGAGGGRANLLVNGGFELPCWQRGDGPFTALGAYTADRWQIAVLNLSTVAVTRNTAQVEPGVGGVSCLAASYTHAAGGSFYLRQAVEQYQQLRGRTLAVAVRVKSPVRVDLVVNDGVSDLTLGQHSGGNNWETLGGRITVAPGATRLLVDVRAQTASGTVYVDNAVVAEGPQGVAYSPPADPGDDLRRCQRYYEIAGDLGGSTLRLQGIATAAGQSVTLTVPWKVAKAIVPTVTKVGTWTVQNCGQPVVNLVDRYGAVLLITSVAAGEFFAVNNLVGTGIIAESNP